MSHQKSYKRYCILSTSVGVRAAKGSGAHVVAVPSLQNQDDRYLIADCVLHSLLEFKPDLWGLPAFSDCKFQL